MTEWEASIIASVLGGDAWQPIPGMFYILFRREDASVVVLGDGVVREYADRTALERGEPRCEIELSATE